MASTSSCSELYSDLLKTCEQHRAHSTPPSSRQHKRVDSTEFAWTGALFQPNGKQKSWPRPPVIDIPYEEASPVQYTSSEMTLEPDRFPRQRPGPLRRHWSSADAHLLSKEDVALVIEQRDRLATRAKPPVQQSAPSHASSSEGAPSTIDEGDIPGRQTPTMNSQVHIQFSRPNTPPPPSVATTEDGQHDDHAGPVSPDPWSSYYGRKRKRSEGGDEAERD